MKRPVLVNYLNLACMVFVAVSTVVGAGQEDKVTLSLRLHADKILTHEPLGVTVLLKNNSDEVVSLWAGYASTLKFSLARVGREDFFMTFGGSQEGRDLVGRNIAMPPGKEICLMQQILLAAQGGRQIYLFENKGKCRLEASVLLSTNGALRSKAVDIEVEAPDRDEILPANIMANIKVGRFFQGWELDEKILTSIEQMVTEYPQSIYSDHARYALGEYYADSYSFGPNKNSPLPEKAYKYLSQVSPRNKVLRARAVLKMAEIVVRGSQSQSCDGADRLLLEMESFREVLKDVGLEKTWGTLNKALEVRANKRMQ